MKPGIYDVMKLLNLFSLNLLAIALAVQPVMAAEYILSASPTERELASRKIFEPIAAYLSETIGERFVFEYAQNWPAYSRNMQASRYDLVFDAPNFVGWRVEKIEHTPLARLPENLVYVVIVDAADKSVSSPGDLKGQTVCSGAIPNLDALILLEQFNSPWARPRIKAVQGFKQIFDQLAAGRCAAAVLPENIYQDLTQISPASTRVLFRSQSFPNFAFSASPRMPAALQQSVKAALISTNSSDALSALRQHYRSRSGLLPADRDKYRGLGYMLEDFWGF
jgi:ABC-type phosphate/phosphonate transport system substrate-binding protein